MDNLTIKIEELRKKINLSESIKKSCYEESEEEKLKNAHYIATLKEDIVSYKITESSKSSFTCPVKNALYNNKQSRDAIEWFDQWILDTEKQINLLKHVERKNQETLIKLQDEKIMLVSKPTAGNREDLDLTVQTLENNLEKMHMKIIEAEFVEKKYGVVIAILESEILQLQKDTGVLDSDVSKIKSELYHIKSTADNALKSSRVIRTQLAYENNQFQKQKFTWEQTLRSFHQQVDSINLDNYSRRKSIQKMPSLNETFISCEESSSAATECLTSRSKDILGKLKLSAGSAETIMLEFSENPHQMAETINNLQELITNLQGEKESLLTELDTGLTSTKLTASSSLKLERQNEKLKDEHERKLKTLKTAEMFTKFVETLRAALRQLNTTIALGCKINSLSSPSPDDTLELLTMCMERVEYLIEQSQEFDRENAIQIYDGAKFNENVEAAQQMLKPKSKTSRLSDDSSKTTIKLEEYDTADQEIPTRASIKRQAKTMIDYHAKLHAKGPRAQASDKK